MTRFWTVAELDLFDKENRCSIGEPNMEGWYYQLPGDLDAPIGPYATEAEAEAALRADDRA